MHRRELLTTGSVLGMVALTGCLGFGSSDDETTTEGDDEDPFDAEPDDLTLTPEQAESVLEGGWSVEDASGDPPLMFDAADIVESIVPFDGEDFRPDDGRVMNGVWVYEDVEEAREAYETHPRYVDYEGVEAAIAVESQARSVDTMDIGSWGYVLFRDANVMGAVSFRKPETPDEEEVQTAAELATIMHESWRD